MDITLRAAEIITIPEPLTIENIRDSFQDQKITARISRVPREIVLWEGAEAYAAAGNWTNDTALAQLSAVLSLSSIPWN